MILLCLKFWLGVRSLGRVSEVFAGFPKFWRGFRSLERFSEVWAEFPKFGKGFRSLERVFEVRARFPKLGHVTLVSLTLSRKIRSCGRMLKTRKKKIFNESGNQNLSSLKSYQFSSNQRFKQVSRENKEYLDSITASVVNHVSNLNPDLINDGKYSKINEICIET